MEHLDIPALAEKISDHRFDGYTDNMIADEIDRFRSGQGSSGLSDAVDALEAVADALVETDETLRTELAKLGVEWQSEAAARAGTAITDNAAFSAEAGERVDNAAKRVFAQGEAFNRTLHKLPDSQALREGAGGYTTMDSMLSLLGFETDHINKVTRAREAREQALQALNDYARLSGENLAGLNALESPRQVRAEIEPGVPGPAGPGAAHGDVTSTAGTAAPAPGRTGGAGGMGGVAAAPGPGTSTPAIGLVAQEPASRPTGRTAPSTTRAAQPVSGPAPHGVVSPGAAPGRGASGGTAPGGSAPGSAGSAAAGGAAPGSGMPGAVAPGAGAPGTSATGETRSLRQPGVAGTGHGGTGHGTTGHGGGRAGEPQQPLPKGKSFGAAPTQPPAVGMSGAASGGATPRGGLSANDVGAGAAAVGAGAIAGALSGDDERTGRGIGRSAPGAARSPKPAVGGLSEADRARDSGTGSGSPRQRDAFLRQAAPPTVDDDGEHVRRFGVDDADLFADQRLVSPDLIGDDGDSSR